jgi:hypothetical protein
VSAPSQIIVQTGITREAVANQPPTEQTIETQDNKLIVENGDFGTPYIASPSPSKELLLSDTMHLTKLVTDYEGTNE